MKFVRVIPGCNHLWAVKEDGKKTDELSMLFRQWSNFNYLLDFFFANLNDLQGFFHVKKVSDAIKDTMEDAQELERLIFDFPRVEPNVYIVTGGAIKLTATMQEREHTQRELAKLNACRDYLKQNGVFDRDSFIDFFEED